MLLAQGHSISDVLPNCRRIRNFLGLFNFRWDYSTFGEIVQLSDTLFLCSGLAAISPARFLRFFGRFPGVFSRGRTIISFWKVGGYSQWCSRCSFFALLLILTSFWICLLFAFLRSSIVGQKFSSPAAGYFRVFVLFFFSAEYVFFF